MILLRCLLLLLLLALPSLAWCAPFGTVESLLVQDDRGDWQVATTSGQATVSEGGTESPVSVGQALPMGAVVRTRAARLTLRLANGGDMSIYQDSEITLEAGGVLQSLGRVFYRLRNAFSVRYGSVETVVEGTRFLVDVDGGRFQVEVEEGRVRVRTDGAESQVSAGQRATVENGHAAIHVTRAPVDLEARVRQAFQARPQVHLGAVAGLGSTDALAGHLRLQGGVHLTPLLLLSLDTEVLHQSGENRFPQVLGLGLEAGALTVTPGLVTSFHTSQDACGERRVVLNFGGSIDLLGRLPLGSHLQALVGARAGALSGDAAFLDLSLGLGVNL